MIEENGNENENEDDIDGCACDFTKELVSCNFYIYSKALIIQEVPAFVAGTSELSAF